MVVNVFFVKIPYFVLIVVIDLIIIVGYTLNPEVDMDNIHFLHLIANFLMIVLVIDMVIILIIVNFMKNLFIDVLFYFNLLVF